MPNFALKFEQIKRTGKRRTLNYRQHVKWSYYLCLATAGFIFTTSLGVSVSDILKSSLIEGTTIVFNCSLIPLLLILEAQLLLKPLAFSKIELFDDRLEINNKNKKNQILYSEINKISFSHIPNIGGWFKLETNRKNYRFTVVLEHSEYILESIAAYNNKLISENQLNSYRITALVADQTWANFYQKLKPKKYWLNKYLITPFLCAMVIASALGFKHQPFNFKKLLILVLVTVVFQVLISFLAWLITSLILTTKINSSLKKRSNYLVRNSKFEDQLEWFSQTAQKVQLAVAVVTTCFIILSK